MSDNWWHQLKHWREESNTKTRSLGFTPAEDAGMALKADKSNISLQWAWREAGCRRDPAEILPAVIDALTQEGIPAWPGDATSIVEQIVRVQYDRAEAALKELDKFRSTTT